MRKNEYKYNNFTGIKQFIINHLLINTTTPLYKTTTNQARLLYGADLPMLEPGKKYACRLRAYDTGGADLFKNYGFSEVLTFTFGKPCKIPINVMNNRPGKKNIILRWNAFPGHTEFILRYREKDQTKWYEDNASTSPHNITGLNSDKNYEYQIKGVCGSVSSSYSDIKEFKTAQLDNSQIDCNSNSDIPTIDGTPSIDKLEEGDTINIGGFSAQITTVNKAGAGFSGECMISNLWISNMNAKFENIKVNESMQVTVGEIIAVKSEIPAENITTGEDDGDGDGNGEGEGDGDGDGTGEDEEEGNEEDNNTTIVNDTIIVHNDLIIDSTYVDENGNTIILYTDGSQETIEAGNNVTITDGNGNQVVIDENGNVTENNVNEEAGFANKAGDKVKIGPITFTLMTDPVKNKGDDKCSYSVEKTDFLLTFSDESDNNYSQKIAGASLKYDLDCDDAGLLKAVVEWKGETGIPIKNIGFIDGVITGLKLTIEKNSLSGEIEFKSLLNEDKKTDSYIVKTGINGDFKFIYNTGNSLTGKFDFTDVKDINIDVLKNNKILASATNCSINSEGKIFADISCEQEFSYKENDFNISITKFNSNITLNPESDLIFNSLTGEAIVSDITGINTALNLEIEKTDDEISAKIINSDNLDIYGIQFEASTLTASFNNKFEILQVKGENLSVNSEFKDDETTVKGEFTIDNVVIENSKLKKLTGAGSITHPSYGEIKLINGKYHSDEKVLIFQVDLDTESNTSDEIINEVAISEDGSIKLSKISTDRVFKIGPLTVEFKENIKRKNKEKTAKVKVLLQVKENDLNETISFETEVTYIKPKKENFTYLKIDINKLDIDFPEIYNIKNKLKSVNLLYQKNQNGQKNFEGKLEFISNLNKDKSIYKDVVPNAKKTIQH